ncbi:MAG: hypothetical protein Q3962_06135 [Corynebacterium sp.]|nr:hypothetical protein [Corynebacterium sp.]
MYKSIVGLGLRGWVLLFLIPALALGIPDLAIRILPAPDNYTQVTAGDTPIGNYRCAVDTGAVTSAWDCGDAYIATMVYDVTDDLDSPDRTNEELLDLTTRRFIRLIDTLVAQSIAYNLTPIQPTHEGEGLVTQLDTGVVITAIKGNEIYAAYVEPLGRKNNSAPFVAAAKEAIVNTGPQPGSHANET